MIIKKQDLNTKSLTALLTYINGKLCIPSDANDAESGVVTLKSVNPGSGRGLYSVDLEFNETYTSRSEERKPTPSNIMLHIYDMLVDQYQ